MMIVAGSILLLIGIWTFCNADPDDAVAGMQIGGMMSLGVLAIIAYFTQS